jgi:hypothetical protein
MRSLLRFIAFASTTLVAVLQAGLIATLVSGRSTMAKPTMNNANCANCCKCGQTTSCWYRGVGRTCRGVIDSNLTRDCKLGVLNSS